MKERSDSLLLFKFAFLKKFLYTRKEEKRRLYMRDKSYGFTVVFFLVGGISMKQQQEIYDLLEKTWSLT